MEQKVYRVQFGSRIAGSADSVVVIAQSEDEAMEIAKPMLNTRKLVPDFLNRYGQYFAEEVIDNET